MTISDRTGGSPFLTEPDATCPTDFLALAGGGDPLPVGFVRAVGAPILETARDAVANRHERLPPNPQSGMSAEAAPKCCLGVSLSIPARYSTAGFPAKFFDSGRKPIHAFGDPRLGNG